MTSDYIVDELLTLFAVRGQKAKGIEWRTNVLDRDGARFVRVGEDDFSNALRVYERYQDKDWSFTDCTSYVVMQRLQIKQAFSFDQHYHQFGTVAVVPFAD